MKPNNETKKEADEGEPRRTNETHNKNQTKPRRRRNKENE